MSRRKRLSPRVAELLDMLRYKRPDGTTTETIFANRFIATLPGVTLDEAGNYWCRVGEYSPIMWSSHIDTVHKTEGFQRITYGHGIATTDGSHNECLGADCTTGVWLMRNMVLAGVPGLYLFHAAEEVGGHGSSYIAKRLHANLSHIRFAIAFDRKGVDEIITHQGWQRTASDEFADSLAAALDLPLTASDRGTFTDTANYADLIPECTNIAVGYYKQHTKDEYQDVSFALRLLDAILKADFSTLVCSRDPADNDWDFASARYSRPGDDFDQWPDDEPGKLSLSDFVKRNPETVTDFLEMMGVDQQEIEKCLDGAEASPWNRH